MSMRVVVSGVRFSAAHFVFCGKSMECLHGHNYEIEADVKGKPGKDGMIIDFRVLKSALKHACAPLDHKIILASGEKATRIAKKSGSVAVLVQEKKYVFPAEDVALLPVRATTAEELARLLYSRVKKKVKGLSEIRVFESPHCSASYP